MVPVLFEQNTISSFRFLPTRRPSHPPRITLVHFRVLRRPTPPRGPAHRDRPTDRRLGRGRAPLLLALRLRSDPRRGTEPQPEVHSRQLAREAHPATSGRSRRSDRIGRSWCSRCRSAHPCRWSTPSRISVPLPGRICRRSRSGGTSGLSATTPGSRPVPRNPAAPRSAGRVPLRSLSDRSRSRDRVPASLPYLPHGRRCDRVPSAAGVLLPGPGPAISHADDLCSGSRAVRNTGGAARRAPRHAAGTVLLLRRILCGLPLLSCG